MDTRSSKYKNLSLILDHVSKLKLTFTGTYYIPEIWDSFGFREHRNNLVSDPRKPGEIGINPYEFIEYCIKDAIIPAAKNINNTASYLESLKNYEMPTNPGQNVIYIMLPRMFTAWDHYNEGEILTGTFLKTICMIPYLKNIGVDIINLLPVFEYSNLYKKGEIGGPYAIKNIYRIDPNMSDILLSDSLKNSAEIECKAFIEACHMLGIRVMMDFAFRTCARDCDLIMDHPDWFYWIYKKYNDNFHPPCIGDTDETCLQLTEKVIQYVYSCKTTKDYILQFTYDPRTIDRIMWNKLIEEHKSLGTNILNLIEEQYGITTVPGFSDVMNDPQPQWTDVTVLRLYFGSNSIAKKYITKDYPPYIMQDGIKCSRYGGDCENEELYYYISEVIPYYQKNFGIDGARIDMGHALPDKLNEMIISKAKSENSNFILWSEEINPKNAEEARKIGFHVISGNAWYSYSQIRKIGFNNNTFNDIIESKLPIIGALEIPDTQRIALNCRNSKELEMFFLINSFIPNAILTINNGQEIMEIQPMNLGLGDNTEGSYALPKDDPMYGKMAFFDNYCLHWLKKDGNRVYDFTRRAVELRKRFAHLVGNRLNYVIPADNINIPKNCIYLCYLDFNTNENVFLIANFVLADIRDTKGKKSKMTNNVTNANLKISFSEVLPNKILQLGEFLKCIYCSNVEYLNKNMKKSEFVTLAPFEVFIGTIEKQKTS